LENDLLSINDRGSVAASSLSEGGPGEKGRGGLAGLAIGGGAGGAKGKEAEGSASKAKLPAAPAAAGASQTDNSILPIVTSQRDRFRARNAELEEELRKQFDTISDLRREVKALQADNLKLYEKVRYIGSYREDASSGVAGPSTSGGRAGLDGVGVGRDDIGRYKDKYDESLNPFESFKSRVGPALVVAPIVFSDLTLQCLFLLQEAQRAIQALNPIERAVFALCRSIIGNRRARSIFVVRLPRFPAPPWVRPFLTPTCLTLLHSALRGLAPLSRHLQPVWEPLARRRRREPARQDPADMRDDPLPIDAHDLSRLRASCTFGPGAPRSRCRQRESFGPPPCCARPVL